jgi:hypothetical protein
MSTFRFCVVPVVFVRAQEKALGIHAGWIVALVEHALLRRQISVGKHP